LTLQDLVGALPLPVRTFVYTWYGGYRRGEVQIDRPTIRVLLLDLIAALPVPVRTFIYTRYGEYRRQAIGAEAELSGTDGPTERRSS
jgi:hypothetical protein